MSGVDLIFTLMCRLINHLNQSKAKLADSQRVSKSWEEKAKEVQDEINALRQPVSNQDVLLLKAEIAYIKQQIENATHDVAEASADLKDADTFRHAANRDLRDSRKAWEKQLAEKQAKLDDLKATLNALEAELRNHHYKLLDEQVAQLLKDNNARKASAVSKLKADFDVKIQGLSKELSDLNENHTQLTNQAHQLKLHQENERTKQQADLANKRANHEIARELKKTITAQKQTEDDAANDLESEIAELNAEIALQEEEHKIAEEAIKISEQEIKAYRLLIEDEEKRLKQNPRSPPNQVFFFLADFCWNLIFFKKIYYLGPEQGRNNGAGMILCRDFIWYYLYCIFNFWPLI